MSHVPTPGLDEDAQFAVYVRLIEAMAGGRVTVRTFDVSEGQMGLTHAEHARSPLGLRGLRLSLSFDEVFQAQLRAVQFRHGIDQAETESIAGRRAAPFPSIEPIGQPRQIRRVHARAVICDRENDPTARTGGEARAPSTR